MSSDPALPVDGEENQLFVSLLVRNHARLLGYIRTLVPHRQDAEDLFQKVSLTLWNKFSEFDRERDFFTWASKVAFFTVCNHRRTRYRNCLTFNQELIDIMSRERIDHLQTQEERLDLLIDCVEKLSRTDRQLVLQAYSQNLSIGEIAGQLGKAVQTLYNRLTFLRRELVECVNRKSVAQQRA